MNNSGVLGYSVRELMQRAAKLIMQHSKSGPKFERHIDLEQNLEIWDPKLQRIHPITVRLRITVRSRILEKTQTHPELDRP